MIVRAMRGKHLGQTSYFLCQGDDMVIVDAGFDVEALEEFLATHDYNVLGVFLTHGHFDHTMSAAELIEKGYPVYGSEHMDEVVLEGKDMSKYFELPYEKFSVPNKLKDNDILHLGNFEIQALYTPGHTVDGMCYIINGKLLSGDTLLSGAYGRVDLPTADKDAMKSSLKRLLALDKKMHVLSGHDRAYKRIDSIVPKMTVGDYLASQDIAYFLLSDE